MVSDADSASKALNREQELSNILEHLNPPLDQLASEADLFLHKYHEPSIERVLAAYFELFALGYTLWDRTYYYHSIHEYFYGAYLVAKQLAADLHSSELEGILEMLEQISRALIAFTWYENALARNDPKGAFNSVNDAIAFIEKALDLLDHSSLAQSLKSPIKKYLNNNRSTLHGLHYCVKIYLDTLKNVKSPLAYESEIDRCLGEISSSELQTYLRVQCSYALHYKDAHAQKESDLSVKDGQILLRTIGYVGEDLISALFDSFAASSATPEKILEVARSKTNLPLASVRSSYMQDIFETILGKEYLKQIIFDLAYDHSTNTPALTFFVRDGEKDIVYPVKTFQACVTRFGTISVEFGIPLDRASVSHVRVLESLIGPDTIQFDFVWRGAPSGAERGITDFVDYYLKSLEWVKRIRHEMPTIQSSTADEMKDILGEMDVVLKAWCEDLREIAFLLPHSSVESPEKTTEATSPLEKMHKALQDHHNNMSSLVNKWVKQVSALGYSELDLVKSGSQLFPTGVRFGRLMDIAQEIFKGIECYLCDLYEEEEIRKTSNPSGEASKQIIASLQHVVHKEKQASSEPAQSKDDLDKYIRQLFYFDPSTGWSAILVCNRLTIAEHNKGTNEPSVIFDYKEILKHPEFKGLIMPNRAARVSLDDWLFATAPSYRNLAPIRFHKNDILCISENQAYIYMLEEPEWIVKQVIETARLIGDIRTLVLTFNKKTRNQLNSLMSYFDEMRISQNKLQYSQQDKKLEKNLRRYHDELMSKRDEIEDLRGHAENILDLLRSCTISKYQDHSDLLKEVIKESRVNDYRESLEHNIENLDRFHAYLTEKLKSRIDRRIQSNQNLTNGMLVLLTFLSGLAAIPSLNQFLDDLLGGMVAHHTILLAMGLLLVTLVLGGIAASLIIGYRSRNT